MAWNESQMPTRSSMRHNRNRFSRILNWAIGIVVVAIVIVGGYLLYSIMSSPASNNPSHKTASPSKSSTHASTSNSSSTKTSDNRNANSQSSASATSSDTSSNSSNASNTSDTGGSSEAYHFVGGGPNGPWEPIGTVQSGPHTTNYKLGSVDWNERVKALLYATDINDNDYILWRLENGGAPDKSLGIISTKETPNKKYDVMLKWVKNKGWEPLSVTLESASTNQGAGTSGASDQSSTANASSNTSGN